jgi:pseudouridine-5'-phosphate glycosidase
VHLEPWGDSLIQVAPEVRDALDSGRAVVALETTLVSHGFPGAEGLDVALEAERRVRAAGAVPATVGVLDRRVQVGLDPDELERFAAAGDSAGKAGPRDLAVCVATGALGATTVGGTLAVCAVAGVRFMGTGGIGGVHRGFVERPDVSADLGELARASVLVVSSGVKSLLDVTATLEVLETLGVPVLGWQVETLPLFYTAEGGPPAPATIATASDAAAIARAHWSLGRAGLVLARPPAENLEVEPLIEAALAEARARQVTGQAVTPFVLAEIHRESGGETVRINKRLIADNAALAAEVAVAYTAA